MKVSAAARQQEHEVVSGREDRLRAGTLSDNANNFPFMWHYIIVQQQQQKINKETTNNQ